MNPHHAADRIDLPTFKSVLAKYDSLVSKLSGSSKSSDGTAAVDSLERLERLDRWRFEQLPVTLQERAAKEGAAWLEKPEVEDLVKWKLKHGKFRPRLTQLVASNPSSIVFSTTKEAFASYASTASASPLLAIKKLSTLKGIGPASASLLLAVYNPKSVPFFSDECFRWLTYEQGGNGGQGWDRSIKYDAKEYALLVDLVKSLRERLLKESGEEVPAAEVEKVAFVLGKQAELGEEVEEGKEKDKPRAGKLESNRKKEEPKDVSAGRKRKSAPGGEDLKASKVAKDTAPRRSSRRQT